MVGSIPEVVSFERLSSVVCRLEPLSFDHTSDVVRWRNDPENARWFFGERPFTREGHEEWLARQLAVGKDKNWIIMSRDDKPVGTVSIYNIDDTRSAEFGRLLIGEATARGHGYGQSATELALMHARASGIERVYLHVRGDNVAAMKLYRRLGFAQISQSEGVCSMELKLSDPK